MTERMSLVVKEVGQKGDSGVGLDITKGSHDRCRGCQRNNEDLSKGQTRMKPVLPRRMFVPK